MLYESLLLIGVEFLLFLMPHVMIGLLVQFSIRGPILLVHVLTVAAIYFIWFWQNVGQTLPMRTWKIKLLATNRDIPTTPQLLLRFILAGFGLLLGGLSVIWAFFDRDRQFLHDRLAGTRLVMQEEPEIG